MVLKYCGDDPFLVGKVLRLPKVETPFRSELQKNGVSPTRKERELDAHMVDMMGRSACYIPRGIEVHMCMIIRSFMGRANPEAIQENESIQQVYFYTVCECRSRLLPN